MNLTRSGYIPSFETLLPCDCLPYFQFGVVGHLVEQEHLKFEGLEALALEVCLMMYLVSRLLVLEVLDNNYQLNLKN